MPKSDREIENIQTAISDRLRLIADHLKKLEDAQVKEAIAREDRHISRELYHDDLTALADMLEDNHRTYQMKLSRRRGRPSKPANVDRDFEIARAVRNYRDAGMQRDQAIQAVAQEQKLNYIDEATVEAAYDNMKRFLNMSENDQQMILMFKRMKARQGSKLMPKKTKIR